MLSRIGGRLVTSPVAFFLAGAIDIAWLLFVYARWRVAQRRERGGAGAVGSATGGAGAVGSATGGAGAVGSATGGAGAAASGPGTSSPPS